MTTQTSLLRRLRLLAIAGAALALLLSACQYRPEQGAGHEAEESHAPSPATTGSASPKGSVDPTVCPTEEGLTNCGLGATNAPPAATGDFRVTTLAGSGSRTFADGSAEKASFIQPIGVTLAADGSVLVADAGANRIRKVAKDGTVTTVAGTGAAGYVDGPAASAQFRSPRGVAVAADGTIYVADSNNHVIRAISPAGQVTTLAGSPGRKGFKNAPGRSALFNAPVGIALDKAGALFVTEFENHTVRIVSKTGLVRTLAGTGAKGFKDEAAAKAQFDSPVGVGVAADGTVYVADAANNRIRKIAGGKVTTLAGDRAGFKNGTGKAALFNLPYGLTIDKAGNVFVTEFANNSIRRVDPKGAVTTIVVPPKPSGSTASPTPARSSRALELPAGIVWTDGRFYVADSGHGLLRLVARS